MSHTGCKALARIVRIAAERIADATFAVHGHASQPTIESAGGVRALLVQHGVALFVQAEFVPAHASAVGRRSYGMLGQNGLMMAEVAVHEPLDQFVTLRIEAAVGTRLRDATAQLAVAEIVIGRHRDLLRWRDAGLGGVLPIDVHFVEVYAVVVKDLHELRAARRHHEVGRAGRRQPLAIYVGVQHENPAVDDHALFRRRQTLEHAVAVNDAVVLLRDYIGQQVVARAGWVVIAVGPDRWVGIIWKQRALELITVIRPQRVGSRAHGIAHGIRALRIVWRSREDRNHDQPPVGQLVVAHYGVAVVARAAANAKAGKNGAVGHGAVEQLAGRGVLLTLLGEHGNVAIKNLEYMVGTDGQADINPATAPAAASVGLGCVASTGVFVTGKTVAQPVKAGCRLNRGTRALGRLLDGGTSGVDLGCGWRRRSRPQARARAFRRALPFRPALYCGMNNHRLIGDKLRHRAQRRGLIEGDRGARGQRGRPFCGGRGSVSRYHQTYNRNRDKAHSRHRRCQVLHTGPPARVTIS